MTRFLTGWARTRHWPASEWWRTAVAAMAVAVAAVALRTFGFYATWRRVAAYPAGANTVDATRLSQAVSRVRRYGPYRGNCLSTSIALLWLLRRHGCDAVLRLGAQLKPEGLTAHAWVELDGVVLNDTADVVTRYTPFGDWRTLSRSAAARAGRHDG